MKQNNQSIFKNYSLGYDQNYKSYKIDELKYIWHFNQKFYVTTDDFNLNSCLKDSN